MAQDFYDILQPFDFMVELLDDHKASLGLRYIAQNDEDLIPSYPAILVQCDNTEREHHATRLHMVTFFIDVWVFHAALTESKAVRSRSDIELATEIRKLIHSDRTMSGHIIDGFVNGEFPGISTRVIENEPAIVVTTRLAWQGVNRVPFEAS